MKEMRITGIAIVSDCFQPDHPKEDAVNLLDAINRALVKLSGSPIIAYEHDSVRVTVNEIPDWKEE